MSETNSLLIDNATVIVAELTNTIKSYGANITGYDDDLILVSCKNKQSFNDVIDFLDNDEHVDTYNVDVFYQNPIDGVGKKIDIDSIDVSRLNNYNSVYFDIAVFIKPEYVDYSNVWFDVDTTDDLHEKYKKTNRKKPLWMALNGTPTKCKGGTFIVEPHPTKRDTIWLYIEYQFNKNITHEEFYNNNKSDIHNDLKNINSGEIANKFIEKNFTIKKQLKLSDNDVEVIATYQKPGRLQTKHIEYVSNEKVNVRLLLEMFEGAVIFGEIGVLNEIERQLKVNFKGKKRIKIKCQKGYKYDHIRKACVKIGGSELATMRKAKIKMSRTKKSKGEGYKRIVLKKTKKAKRFRKLMGK